MGSFEKLVVLVVVFLSTIVLAISISRHDPVEAAGPTSPGGAVSDADAEANRRAEDDAATRRRADDLAASVARAEEASAPTTGPTEATAPANEPAAPADALLSQGVLPRGDAGRPAVDPDAPADPAARGGAPVEAPEPVVAEAPAPDGSLLSTEGLRPVAGGEAYEFAVDREGETFVALAERFYGDRRALALLRRYNEDVRSLELGTRVLLPARIVVERRPEPLPARPATDRPAPATPPVVNAPGDSTEPGATFREHTVAAGETLSSISESYYGTGNYWKRIHDANRDVLPNPDRLTVGTVLRIP